MYRLLIVLILSVTVTTVRAQDVTVKRSLSELGYPEGLTLQHREDAEFFINTPAGISLENGTVHLEGRVLAPVLARGSLVVRHNTRPIDARRIAESEDPQVFALDAPLQFFGTSNAGFGLKLSAELVAEGAACSAEGDPANSIFLSPASYASYQVDRSDIDTVAKALSLLPRRVPIVVPPEMPDTVAAAAIQLGSTLEKRRHQAVYVHETPGEGVYFHLQAEGDGIHLDTSEQRLEIVVSAGADIGAFERLWTLMPSAAGSELTFDDAPVPASASREDGFFPFNNLPPLRMTGASAALTTSFGYLGMEGRRPRELLLNLAIAPDWSAHDPIVSVLLNGQLIEVSRPGSGRNRLRVPLPAELLTFRNILSLNVSRAVADSCRQEYAAGFPVQLTKGSGVIYGAAEEKGFAEFARMAQSNLVVVLPDDAEAALDGVAFSAHVLAGLGLGGTKVRVQQALAQTYEGAAIRLTGVDTGLQLPREYASDNSTRFSTDMPLARLDVAVNRPLLNVVYSTEQGIPDPATLDLGTGTAALAGDAGILWQNAGELERLSLAQRTLNSINDLLVWLRNDGAWIWPVVFGALAIVLISRIVIGRAARRSRH